ncbi:splicing factor YJU2-like [Octopus sinensis]|uniref:Splicing factor YJU2-like n=1 Tax=Octopus sinensis TaxID=2607531 RepID=A0A6P7U475_9MOLL|nr:splicing factor YJU2-like [Octopus sinensis]
MRFYIRCPNCVSEITFKTDLANMDYAMEFGATRAFQALRMAQKQAKEEMEAEKEEEANNPMKLLESRTKQSYKEMENMEALEIIQDSNLIKKNVINYEDIIEQDQPTEEDQDEQALRLPFYFIPVIYLHSRQNRKIKLMTRNCFSSRLPKNWNIPAKNGMQQI